MSGKGTFAVCFFILSASLNAYASLYFSGAMVENIDLIYRPIEEARWHSMDTVYKIRKGQERSRWEKIDGSKYCSLESTESLFFQVPGLFLVKIDISGAPGQPDPYILEKIEVYQVSGVMETAGSNRTRVKVIPMVDDHGAIYVRAPMGDVIGYEISHQLGTPLKIRCFGAEYLPIDFSL